MAILEVQDIHTYYGDAYVLQGMSLRLEQGQILGLLGRNGVGKTTLVNSIVGFTPPRRGKIAASALLQVIRQLGGYTLRDISMVSEYQGPQLEAGARSLSFRLHYQADDRTLTNEEVAAVQQHIIDGLRSRFGAEVRS